METSVKFYLIGGALRDSFLGIKSKDLDFVVVAPSYNEMKQAILNQGGEIFLEKEPYLTIRGRLPEVGAADFVLARKDGIYSDNRRPDSVEIGSLYEDQKRRDFTCNAIAKDLISGEIIDPFGGMEDINQGILRCVGNARDRFLEDGLRLARAIRFHITKKFELDSDIEICLHEPFFIDLLAGQAIERIYDEFCKMFVFDTYKTLEVLRRYPYLERKIFKDTKLWLQPTLKEK